MMRGRREERREERRDDRQLGRPGGGGNRYQMRQKMIAIGDDFWIEDERGQRVFKVDGKALRVRQTLIFEDARGNELCKIQERMLRIKDSMEIEAPNGQSIAMVKKALITPIRERWVVKVQNGPTWKFMETFLTMSTRSAKGVTRSPKYPRDGSASPTATAWQSRRDRTTC